MIRISSADTYLKEASDALCHDAYITASFRIHSARVLLNDIINEQKQKDLRKLKKNLTETWTNE